MKKTTSTKFIVSMGLCLFCGSAFALNYGSLHVKGAEMYEQGNPGGNVALPRNYTIDYKVVTLDGKTWAWTKANNGSIVGGAGWASQLRYWGGADFTAKTENNLTGRLAGGNETIGSTTSNIPAPMKISVFMDITGFSETLQHAYDPTVVNDRDVSDTESPLLTNCDATTKEVTADLVLNGTDNSGNVFYSIEDAANGIKEISLVNSFTLTGLLANTAYNLIITPIDFNGNIGTPLHKSFRTAGLVQISNGIAKEIRFVIKSTNNVLEYYCEPTDPTKELRETSLKITPSGGSEFELKPVVSPDRKYAYIKSNDSRLVGKVLSLNCGYFIYVEGEPIWEDYVVENKVITEGENAGNPIMHMMGGAIANPETVKPVLNSVSIVEQTPEYVKLNLDGSDNSGIVYYTIVGGKEDVSVFHTGEYYFTSFEKGKTYTLSITAVDLSGNISEKVETILFKTRNQRSTVFDNDIVGLQNDQKVKVGFSLVDDRFTVTYTTTDPALGASHNRKFQTARIEAPGQPHYIFAVDKDSTTATYTYPDAVTEGGILPMRMVWVWQNGGTFWSADYFYVVGDVGQADTMGPIAPALTVTGDVVSWNACQDLLTGVDRYEVFVDDELMTTIPDLGQSEFTYTVPAGKKKVKVAAIDFNNNRSETTINDITTNITQVDVTDICILNNGDMLCIEGMVAASVRIFDLNGRIVVMADGTNDVNVATLEKGIYLIRVNGFSGDPVIRKIVIQ